MGESTIGAQTARSDSLQGQVACVAIADDSLARAVVDGLAGFGAVVERVKTDADVGPSQHMALTKEVEALAGAHGRLNVWVQSVDAPEATLRPVADLSLESFQQGLAATAGAAFIGAQAAAKHMDAPEGGSFVFLTSVDGLLASRERATASCGAAAVMLLVKSLACEWASRGIRVNAIATTARLAPPLDPRSVELSAAGISPTRIPVGRPPAHQEIAQAVCYLASSRASFVTGEILRVDGGWAAYHLF